jgi:uncharacterized SAM-binding protein YcdF (DUF218 family)
MRRRGGGPGVASGVARAGAALLLALLGGFLWFGANLPGPAPAATRTEGIVVLAGGQARVERGLALMQAGRARRMLVSGVDPDLSDAALVDGLGVSAALAACCVDFGRAARDTRSNAEETQAWAAGHGFTRLRIVTSDTHMRRAMIELRAELGPGVELVPDAVPTSPRPGRIAAEAAKTGWRWLARRVGG